MQQGTIVQFVCFETSVELDEFAPGGNITLNVLHVKM